MSDQICSPTNEIKRLQTSFFNITAVSSANKVTSDNLDDSGRSFTHNN